MRTSAGVLRLACLCSVVTWLATGCYQTPKPNCAFLCGPSTNAAEQCPDGYTCRPADGRCHLVLSTGAQAECTDTLPGDASIDGPTFDAPPGTPDAGIDAGPVSDHSGSISVQDLSIQGHPELGHGLSISLDLTPNDPIAPAFDDSPGQPTGCKGWVYDVTAGQGPQASTDEGTVTFGGISAAVPACTFVAGQGYLCIAGAGAGGTGDMIIKDAGGAGSMTGGLLDVSPSGYTFVDADVGRYISISGATDALNNGSFPIVGVDTTNNAAVYGNPFATSAAFTSGMYLVVAGAGPVPGAPDPILDTDSLTVHIAPGGGGHFHFPDATVPAGDAFTLDSASQATIVNVPTDGSAMSLTCDDAAGQCGSAVGTIVLITTTDGSIAGLPGFSMPKATGKIVIGRCAQIGAKAINVPAGLMALVQNSGATRIRTLYIRTGFLPTGNSDGTNPVNLLAGHSVAGFTTP